MFLSGYDNIENFCKSEDWKNSISISNQLFLENYYLSEEFKGIVDALVRQHKEKNDDEHSIKMYEYLEMFG